MTRPEQPSLLIGVDTGGTYTDAVALRVSTAEVVHSAKALTTRHDLAVGVSEALTSVVAGLDVDTIALVAVSTTLATNAVVEGHGSPILVLLVGFDEPMIERTEIRSSFGDAHVVAVAGGHNHHGLEAAPLDVDKVHAALNEFGSSVSAVAVASTFAVRNPSHELAVRDIVESVSELAVTISSSLSDSLDAPRRALTTALNARLLSRVTDLIAAVDQSMTALDITAPVMVAKGDGSLAIAESVARRPIETILSGPAASIIGAGILTGLDDYILSDIGGTTTDVALVEGGRLRFAVDGAAVGGWRTMVEAIDVRTTGLGGDSAVRTDKIDIALGPERRVPLALAAMNDPSIEATLAKQLADPPPRDFAGLFVQRVAAETPTLDLSAMEARVLSGITTEPEALVVVASGALERRAVNVLVEKGVVQVVGFTPSDASHVLGLQSNWSTEAAQAGAALLSWYTGESPLDLCRRVWSEMARRSSGCVLDVALDGVVPEALRNPVTEAAARGDRTLGAMSLSVGLEVPIVAVGGPAGVYYEEVAQRLGATLELPMNFAVANAVGAAGGHVVTRGRAEVHADGPGSYRIIGPTETTLAEDGDDAIAQATEIARSVAEAALAERMAGISGGTPEERIDVTRHVDPNSPTEGQLYGAEIEVELRVKPYVS